MVNRYIFSFVFTLLLISCGTRKVESEKLEGIEINNSYSNGSKIVLGTNLTFTPFNNLKPYKVDGKEYVNVVVSNATNKTIERWRNRTIYKTKTIYQTKLIQKTDYTILYIGLFSAFLVFVFAWLKF